MNSYRRSYIFGIILLGVGFYYAYKADLLEFALYGCAGLTFIVNALTSEPSLARYKKPLAITSWMFIFVTGALFLYLLQFKLA